MDTLRLAQQLLEAREPFVLATVVRCERPVSAHPGAKAVVRQDGTIEGWVGGGCAQDLVSREARQALADGEPRLLRLSPYPDEKTVQAGVSEYLMTCHSGGTLEIFIEPIFPPSCLWVVGESPVARTLGALAGLAGFDVRQVSPSRAGRPLQTVRESDFVVVASMSAADEGALEEAVRSGAGYVALVASRKRAAVLREYLAGRGVPPEQLARLAAPAGLNIGAREPEEIAVSVLAEMVRVRSKQRGRRAMPDQATVEVVIDPVCGMGVETDTSAFTIEHLGKRYYFCCARCRSTFEASPEQFVAREDQHAI